MPVRPPALEPCDDLDLIQGGQSPPSRRVGERTPRDPRAHIPLEEPGDLRPGVRVGNNGRLLCWPRGNLVDGKVNGFHCRLSFRF